MKWYINASETEQEIFREWLYGVMCMHEVEIDFIKATGRIDSASEIFKSVDQKKIA